MRGSSAMDTKAIRFPVYCHTCRKEWTYGLPQGRILDALNTGAAILGFAACHNQTWHLNASEREDLAARATKL
jgi:hypothetical protein